MKKWLWLLAVPLMILPGCGEKAPDTTASYHSCSVEQGFDFNALQPEPLGYLTYLKIGGVSADIDLLLKDPMNEAFRIKAVGVVSWLMWRETPDEPVVFAAHVSAANQEKLAALGQTDLTDIEIEFAFTLYKYDESAGKYHKSLSSGSAKLKGALHTQEKHPLFFISEEAALYTLKPENFLFQLGVKPADIPQQIEMAGGAAESYTKPWGQ